MNKARCEEVKMYYEPMTQDEIEKLQKIMDSNKEIPDVDNAEYEILSQDEIDQLLSTIDKVDDEADSDLRHAFIAMRNYLYDYGFFLYECDAFCGSGSLSNFDIEADDEAQIVQNEPIFGEELTENQRKDFDELTSRAEKLDSRIRAETEKTLDLLRTEKLSDVQICECNKMFVQVAKCAVSKFSLSDALGVLPKKEREKILEIQQAVLSSAREFFKRVFAVEKSPLYRRNELHDAWKKSENEKLVHAEGSTLDNPKYEEVYVNQADEKTWNEFFGTYEY